MKILPACAADTTKTYRIITEARSLVPDPDWHCTDSEDYIRSHIIDPDAGIVFKAAERDYLATFFITHFPGSTPDNLGRYMSLEPEALDRVAHMDSLAVRPGFRRKGPQYRLMASTEQYLMTASYCHLIGTAHPDNRYNLGSFLKLGYRVMITTEEYSGLPCRVLYKSISNPPSFMDSGNDTVSVSIYLK